MCVCLIFLIPLLGLSGAKRILDLLEALPAWRAADVVASAVSSSVEVGAIWLEGEPNLRDYGLGGDNGWQGGGFSSLVVPGFVLCL